MEPLASRHDSRGGFLCAEPLLSVLRKAGCPAGRVWGRRFGAGGTAGTALVSDGATGDSVGPGQLLASLPTLCCHSWVTTCNQVEMCRCKKNVSFDYAQLLTNSLWSLYSYISAKGK